LSPRMQAQHVRLRVVPASGHFTDSSNCFFFFQGAPSLVKSQRGSLIKAYSLPLKKPSTSLMQMVRFSVKYMDLLRKLTWNDHLGAGPFDGTTGGIFKYNLTTSAWTDITPVLATQQGGYGFGGLSVDLQKPGTLMAASLNQWYAFLTISFLDFRLIGEHLCV